MASFELGQKPFNNTEENSAAAARGGHAGHNGHAGIETLFDGADRDKPVKDDCIIALKVYDQFRTQDCLTEEEIGPARAAEDKCIGDIDYREGAVIEPPNNAATATVEGLKVKKVIIVEKEPNPFKPGYWDIDLKYVFEYKLTFREADGSSVGKIKANSIFNKRVCMFGSTGSDIVISTDLITHPNGESATIDSAPFVQVEAKAVALSSELKYHRRRPHGDEGCSPSPNRVICTIGLFSIVKIFRIVDILVQSKGFCIPPECEDPEPLNACEFFENLDFPMDIFAPPNKKDEKNGKKTNNRHGSNHTDCDCD
jgi:hypothetical protein